MLPLSFRGSMSETIWVACPSDEGDNSSQGTAGRPMPKAVQTVGHPSQCPLLDFLVLPAPGPELAVSPRLAPSGRMVSQQRVGVNNERRRLFMTRSLLAFLLACILMGSVMGESQISRLPATGSIPWKELIGGGRWDDPRFADLSSRLRASTSSRVSTMCGGITTR